MPLWLDPRRLLEQSVDGWRYFVREEGFSDALPRN